MSQCQCKMKDEACDSDNCICCIAKHIDQLQKEAELEESCLNCSADELGDNRVLRRRFNTRPCILYLNNGRPFEISLCPTGGEPTTSTFRIEEVGDDCCCLIRGLRTEPIEPPCGNDEKKSETKQTNGECEPRRFLSTPFCCTIDLDNVIAIQCLRDTFVNNC